MAAAPSESARDEVPAVTVPLTGSNAGRSVDSADRGFRADHFIAAKLLQMPRSHHDRQSG